MRRTTALTTRVTTAAKRTIKRALTLCDVCAPLCTIQTVASQSLVCPGPRDAYPRSAQCVPAPAR